MALLGCAFGLASLSCGRDVTSPGASVRYAHGISWHAEFPPAYQLAGSGTSGVVDFNRVHVVLHHAGGTVALDTVIDFPAGADSITVTLDVKLLPSAPASGEPLSLNLAYINAAGDTVFKGGPVGVTATPSSPGSPAPAPVTIPVSYTGPGSSAVGVQISPRSGTAVSGSTFSFTAVAVDGSGNTIPNTPIIWNTLDPSIASVPSAAAGNVLAGNVRGSARIEAQLLTGPTDQVTLNVLPLATTIALQSGSGQSGLVGSTLVNPLVALVTASDGLGVGGVTVNFAVASGGGSVGSATAVTNSAGLAQTSWKLGSTVGTQSVTASSGTLTGSPVTFTATGGPGGSMTMFGGNNQFAVANAAVLTPPSVIVKDGSNNPVSGVSVTFVPSAGSSITGPATVTSGGNGVASVGGWTLGSTGSFTLTASASGYSNVVFTGTVNTVAMSVSSAEKLPNGTQQFSVTGGNAGDTYNWSVNGIAGGNATYGTITSVGFYTAPATVPTPSTFAVCAQSVQTPANKGCINVTITATPSAGGELIVLNDINWGDTGLYKSGGIYNYPGNAQFVKNLVGFTTTGVRSSATKVLMLRDSVYELNNSGHASFTADWSEVGNIITGQGYTTVETLVHSDLINVPNDVKVVILMMPGNAFATPEINGLKTFASQGGRILFIGENGSYYAYGIPTEDAFLASMGALMTNNGACDAPGDVVTSVPHQLTAGISASGPGGFFMACVSDIIPGPNDFALMTYNGNVVAAIAKIDLTLYSVSAATRQAPNPRAMRVQNRSAMPVQNPSALPGTAGWMSTGPPPRP